MASHWKISYKGESSIPDHLGDLISNISGSRHWLQGYMLMSKLTFKLLDSYLFHPYIIDFNHTITFVYNKPVIVILLWDNVVAGTY